MAAPGPAPSAHDPSGRDPAAAEDLPARLRRETAALHARVEAATGLPGSIRNRGEYVTLLQRLYGFHAAVDARLGDPRWAGEWTGLGLDLAEYRRSHLLVEDLTAMQEPVSPGRPSESHIDRIEGFAGALGCLYVTEGSSLGGRVIGPAIRSAIGGVPTRFFDSAGRGHPSPWRTLVAALRRFGEDGGDGGAVLDGASSTFQAFELQVAARDAAPVR